MEGVLQVPRPDPPGDGHHLLVVDLMATADCHHPALPLDAFPSVAAVVAPAAETAQVLRQDPPGGGRGQADLMEMEDHLEDHPEER